MTEGAAGAYDLAYDHAHSGDDTATGNEIRHAAGLAAVAAQAWDEGFDVGEMCGHDGYPVSENHIWAKTANPYRAEAKG